MRKKRTLAADRFFDPDRKTRKIARSLYDGVRDLPIVSPHGHVDPRIFAENRPFPDPTELILMPDHYIFRMLYSQGIPLEWLGIPTVDGTPVETDHRKIWQRFADHYFLFAGTPTSLWLEYVFAEVFGVSKKLDSSSAMQIYDEMSEKLRSPEFLPRSLFERFNIEVLTTTDAATDTLEHHRRIRESGWQGRVIPCFRPDGVTDLLAKGWRENIGKLSEVSGIEIVAYAKFLEALEERRRFFKSMGAVSTDHAVETPLTHELSRRQAEVIFQRALKGKATAQDAAQFTAHMLMEYARMSIEDGLVMQIHPGCFRNHNQFVFRRFGPDKGCDIPVATEYTRNLHELLNKYGNDTRLTLIVFTLDESAYSRELAPLAGHYPAMRLGPPWWFHDSIEGMMRFRKMVTETAGFYNTVGFNDDTRAFPSIPARHDLARRMDCNFLAGLVARKIIDMDQAKRLSRALAYDLPKQAYKL
ncbi:MAG: glucuronate isomerase [bacterium]|nr:glucuronate isomerase [candidate division KSB1 bacterium]MDH7558642.1 glucuronate isomerase [bacterium]